ncbi:rRNA pseudouridine synthase [Erysipelotrichaceae bacterium OH741_COT-311]|nr:rRNA pseudouridine synthase [Erysipelotrichaceae bacterium OH741_COT-311]
MRIDKLLASSGYGSRKDVKKLIKDKKVYVNDVLVTKEDVKVDEVHDCIMVEQQRVIFQKYIYLMMNKPSGYLCANEDTEATVFDLIKEPYKNIFTVGRLDKDTEGLLLISNDGQFAHNLMSPKKNIDKTYYVEVKNILKDEDIELLKSGSIRLDHEGIKEAKVDKIDDYHIYLTIQEGKYHQVKRMIKNCNNEVVYLKRVRIKDLQLDPNLSLGEYRSLKEEELKKLKDD